MKTTTTPTVKQGPRAPVAPADPGQGFKVPRRSRKATARRLGIPGTLDHALFQAGGRAEAIAMARRAHTDKQLIELCTLWDTLSASERREAMLLEKLCQAVGLHPSEFLGRIVATAYRYNYDVASYIAAMAAPKIIAARAAYAEQEGGFKDAELVLKHLGFTPEQGPLVSITNQQLSIGQQATGLPAFQDTARTVTAIGRETPTPRPQLAPYIDVLEEDNSTEDSRSLQASAIPANSNS